MKKHITALLLAVTAVFVFGRAACSAEAAADASTKTAADIKAATQAEPTQALPAFPNMTAVPSLHVFSDMSTVPAAPATPAGPGFRLSWRPPAGLAPARIRGYNVYRSVQILGHYERINRQPVEGLAYEDMHLSKGRPYYYKVTAVLADGTEGRPTEPVGMVAGSGPGTAAQRLPHIEMFTSTTLSKVTYLGETAVFVLSGDPGMKAAFDIDGVEQGIAMEEMKPGSYRGVYDVRPGQRVRDTFATATLAAPDGGVAVAKTPATISLLGQRKPTLSGLYAGVLESDRVGLNWPRQPGAEGYYSIYRSTSRVVGVSGMMPISGSISKAVTAYIDTDVTPGVTYYYVLAELDPQGLVAATSENLEVRVPQAGHVSGIEAVEEDSGGKVLKAGSLLKVTMRTKPGGKASFSLGSAARDTEMSENEPGVYGGSYTIREGDGVFTSRVTVSFKDSSGKPHFSSSATFVSVNAPRAAPQAGYSGNRPVVHDIRDDVQTVVGRSGRLTAGKTFTVTMSGDPGCKAYFSLGEGIWKVPMKEDPAAPGVYVGSYTVRPGDNAGTSPDPLRAAYITGYLEGASGAVSEPAAGPYPVVVDTTCDIKVDVSSGSLPADAKSQSKVTFTVTDADGEPVADRRLTVLLEPPARYSGMVGGGGVGPDSTDEETKLLGRLQLDYDDMTDRMGTIGATYTAGFAAKTAIITARDFATGSFGMGYVTTGISSSVNVKLEAPATAIRMSAMMTAPVYQLTVTITPAPGNPLMRYVSGGDPAVAALTADGVSRANVVATLTKDGLPVQGMTIAFGVSGAGGSLTASSATTDSLGRAQVFYVAGLKAGRAVITATETSTGTSATNVVALLADAPAKITVKAYPDVLSADGVSTSRIAVELADVNNNPTENVKVGFSLSGGAEMGSVSADGAVTDTRGACELTYTAGTTPGMATIDVTAVSEPPTDQEVKEARCRVVAPLVYDNDDFTELVVLKWLRAAGEPVGKGEPLAVLGTPLGHMVVYSPAAGVLDQIAVVPGINVMEGKDIGVIK